MGGIGTDMNDVRDAFADLVQCAREIVLPGAAGAVVPPPRPAGTLDDALGRSGLGRSELGRSQLGRSQLGDCIDLTDGMPAYGC